MRNRTTLVVAATLLALAVMLSIWRDRGRGHARELIVYTAQDQDFAEPLFYEFTRRTGIQVRAKFDTESTKTVGLASAILAEARRPRADVFWNNEILNTLRIQRRGMLAPLPADALSRFPEMFRAPDGRWVGFAARARVALVNRERLAGTARPVRMAELAETKWRGQVAMAKPLFGTTATHAACLYAVWEAERARQFFSDLKENEVQILAGNRHAAEAAASGQVAVALTDTDDALGVLAKGAPVEIVFLDQEPDGMGTLVIPNTLSMIAGAAHPAEAEELARFLLSAEVENELARGPSGQMPLGKGATQSPAGLPNLDAIRVMRIDFSRAADFWEQAAADLHALFGDGE